MKNNDNLSKFEENQRWIAEIQEEQAFLLEKAMQSQDPNTLIKANGYWADTLKNMQAKTGGASNVKSIIVDPFNNNNSLGYRNSLSGVSYGVLRKMAGTPIIRSIIETRIEQVASFCSPPKNKYDVGFVIRKKKVDYTSEKQVALTEEDRSKINEYTRFFLCCGREETKWQGDNFETFLRKWTRDCLTLDQGTFEIVSDRKGKPFEFFATDGASFRMIDQYSYDQNTAKSQRVNGYLPKYVQIYNNRVVQDYYPWELCFAVRNPVTDIANYGYGHSELEILIEVVTWMLYGDQYNGKFFSQGSIPKGILKVAGNVNSERLSEFRQQWHSMVRGVQNAWKIPVIDADKWDWIDLTKSNQDMQFSKWQEYLIRVACAVYKMAPEELGIVSSGSPQSNPLFEKSNEQMLKFSKDKGLRPLLRFFQANLNQYVQQRLDPDFEFAFVGIDSDTEVAEVELDTKKGKAFMGFKELRKKYGLNPELEEGDVILDPSYIQAMGQMQNQNQEIESQDEDDAFFVSDEDFEVDQEDDVEKGIDANPLLKAYYKTIKNLDHDTSRWKDVK